MRTIKEELSMEEPAELQSEQQNALVEENCTGREGEHKHLCDKSIM